MMFADLWDCLPPIPPPPLLVTVTLTGIGGQVDSDVECKFFKLLHGCACLQNLTGNADGKTFYSLMRGNLHKNLHSTSLSTWAPIPVYNRVSSAFGPNPSPLRADVIYEWSRSRISRTQSAAQNSTSTRPSGKTFCSHWEEHSSSREASMMRFGKCLVLFNKW